MATKSTKTSKKSNDMTLSTVNKLRVTPGQIVGIVLIIILTLFFGKVAIWEHNYLQTMEGSEREVTETLGIADEGENVDTDQPTTTEISEYVVAADRPRYFSIPSLNIYHARIVEVGQKASGEMSTPYNIYDIGWYKDSVLPGEKGVTVMDGHGGAPGIGVFGSLPKITIGAIIQVEMGDGRLFTYQVVDTATKSLNNNEANDYMPTAFKSPEPSKASLTLITCTGSYWLNQRTYSHRFFARAILVENPTE